MDRGWRFIAWGRCISLTFILFFFCLQSGAQVHYILPQGESTMYNLLIHLHTPYPSFPKLDMSGSLTIDQPLYLLGFNISTIRSTASFKGQLKVIMYYCRLLIAPRIFLKINTEEITFDDTITHILIFYVFMDLMPCYLYFFYLKLSLYMYRL